MDMRGGSVLRSSARCCTVAGGEHLSRLSVRESVDLKVRQWLLCEWFCDRLARYSCRSHCANRRQDTFVFIWRRSPLRILSNSQVSQRPAAVNE